ncbi:TIGR03086 family metal-binding protein [Pseudonocardia humida]|uniref:TIGR03086 family protein n=1 Tax=Pseudonocardia humida TaxID=2800819 RepID=A0ABT1A8S5_9PSEU|nr:TIGR03086 family metal-binding protein [Pseudonocardia humida]MCO1659427.1 TIGR03086 family protein [Pseudonocardia humida]
MVDPTGVPSDTTHPPDADPRPLLHRAADQVVALLAALAPDDLHRPTPCHGLDVRALGGHVLGALRGAALVATGRPVPARPVLVLGAVPVLAARARADRDRLVAAWSDDAVLVRRLHSPLGTVSGREAAVVHALELVVHAWDLATAVGRAEELDAAPAAALVPAAVEFVPARPRGGRVPYGPVVPVPPDACPYERLAGWLGRDPAWSPWVPATPPPTG